MITIFHLPTFVDSATETEISILGNESLPPSALPLKLQEPTTMTTAEYNCLLKFYRIEYQDNLLQSAKGVVQSSNFVNDRIQKIPYINLLGQVYKSGEGSNTRGSYIQAIYIEKNSESSYTYAGYIKYLFAHNFCPKPTHDNFMTRLNPQHVFAFV
ncbi:hypothetical protein CLU79DRAFT_783390, partial [Phycomyces nitens]